MTKTIFTSELIHPDTWLIKGTGSTAYLLVGDNCGLMIDTGDAIENLRAYVETLTDKPVRMVANTHGHFDHTGGNGWFKCAFMGKLAAKIAREPNGNQEIEKYPLDYQIIFVDDGDKIELGNREIEVFKIGGHSPDSTAYLDKRERILFTGDNIGNFVTLNYKCPDPQPSVLLYAMNISKLMARRDEYDYVCAGHGDKLMDGSMVNHALIAALRALEGEEDPVIWPTKPSGPPKNSNDKGPDFSKQNPADKGVTGYMDVNIRYDKRYLHDTTRYDIVKGT